MEINEMETMESTEKGQEVKEEKVREPDKGYRALVSFNRRVEQFFGGPDLRGYNN